MPQALPARRTHSLGAQNRFAFVLAGMIALAVMFAFAFPRHDDASLWGSAGSFIYLLGP